MLNIFITRSCVPLKRLFYICDLQLHSFVLNMNWQHSEAQCDLWHDPFVMEKKHHPALFVKLSKTEFDTDLKQLGPVLNLHTRQLGNYLPHFKATSWLTGWFYLILTLIKIIGSLLHFPFLITQIACKGVLNYHLR